MERGSREDGQNPNQLRLFTCTGNLLHRAHGYARQEREYEMTLKRMLQSICLLTVHPNTTTSVMLQDQKADEAILEVLDL
uniref:Uncharacterized protein n=1 Tax=Zea mays TaxID=4577 RepID=A0A804UFR6_MAIZE